MVCGFEWLVQVIIHRTEYPELEEAHKEHRAQILAAHSTTPNQTLCLRAMSKNSLCSALFHLQLLLEPGTASTGHVCFIVLSAKKMSKCYNGNSLW